MPRSAKINLAIFIMAVFLIMAMFFPASVLADDGLPDTVKPKTLQIIHAAAITLDGITTRQLAKNRWTEGDPITRPLIGTYPTYQRMAPLGAAEVVLSYYLAKRWPKCRWLQIGLSVTHGVCGIRNARHL